MRAPAAHVSDGACAGPELVDSLYRDSEGVWRLRVWATWPAIRWRPLHNRPTSPCPGWAAVGTVRPGDFPVLGPHVRPGVLRARAQCNSWRWEWEQVGGSLYALVELSGKVRNYHGERGTAYMDRQQFDAASWMNRARLIDETARYMFQIEVIDFNERPVAIVGRSADVLSLYDLGHVESCQALQELDEETMDGPEGSMSTPSDWLDGLSS